MHKLEVLKAIKACLSALDSSESVKDNEDYDVDEILRNAWFKKIHKTIREINKIVMKTKYQET